MSNREAVFGPSPNFIYDGVPDLNLPLGATDPTTDAGYKDANGNPYFDIPINAQADGWPTESHGAAFYAGDTNRSGGTYNTSMPAMWNWYKDVFLTNNGAKLGN